MKAPANTKRIFEVSIVYCSLLAGGLASRPPRSMLRFELEAFLSDLAFTVTVVPSIILRRPCWTPSPDTSRPWVITAGLANLSISSKKIIPVSHF